MIDCDLLCLPEAIAICRSYTITCRFAPPSLSMVYKWPGPNAPPMDALLVRIGSLTWRGMGRLVTGMGFVIASRIGGERSHGVRARFIEERTILMW